MKMERGYDKAAAAVFALETAIEDFEAALPALRQLADYQESGAWLRDYAADEAGRLPADLTRGVLSEDGLYDLLRRADALCGRLGIKTEKTDKTAQ